MNLNSSFRLEKLDEVFKNSLEDFENFITEPTDTIDTIHQSLSEIIQRQTDSLKSLKSKLDQDLLQVKHSENELEFLEKNLENLSQQVKINQENFEKKSQDLQILAEIQHLDSLEEAKELNTELTRLKNTLCLFIHLTKIRWNLNSRFSGWILKENQAIEFKIPDNLNDFEVSEMFWDRII